MSKRRSGQRGIAAVELALILPLLMLMLALPLYLGRALYHYQVMQRATHDAARYLSSVSHADMQSPLRTAEVIVASQAIVKAELAELVPGNYPTAIAVYCDDGACTGFDLPASVTVFASALLQDPVLPAYTYNLLGMEGLPLTVRTTMAYVGH